MEEVHLIFPLSWQHSCPASPTSARRQLLSSYHGISRPRIQIRPFNSQIELVIEKGKELHRHFIHKVHRVLNAVKRNAIITIISHLPFHVHRLTQGEHPVIIIPDVLFLVISISWTSLSICLLTMTRIIIGACKRNPHRKINKHYLHSSLPVSSPFSYSTDSQLWPSSSPMSDMGHMDWWTRFKLTDAMACEWAWTFHCALIYLGHPKPVVHQCTLDNRIR